MTKSILLKLKDKHKKLELYVHKIFKEVKKVKFFFCLFKGANLFRLAINSIIYELKIKPIDIERMLIDTKPP